MMNILIAFLLTIHVVCCFLLLLFVLMQRPRAEGLGTAFGGGMAESMFGASAGNILTKITTWLGIIFFVTTILMAYLYSRHQTISHLRQEMKAASTGTPSKSAPPPASAPSAASTNQTSLPPPATSPANPPASQPSQKKN